MELIDRLAPSFGHIIFYLAAPFLGLSWNQTIFFLIPELENDWLPTLLPNLQSPRNLAPAPFSWVRTGLLISPLSQAWSIFNVTWLIGPEQSGLVLRTPAGSLTLYLRCSRLETKYLSFRWQSRWWGARLNILHISAILFDSWLVFKAAKLFSVCWFPHCSCRFILTIHVTVSGDCARLWLANSDAIDRIQSSVLFELT